MIIRLIDILLSLLGIILLSPFFLIIAFLIKIDSKGSVLYKQTRVGKDNIDFKLYKFRSMHLNSEKNGLITVGERDSRITKVGHIIRKYKLDELPQLFNVINGKMSLVGPRPEVRKYVDLYSKSQQKILIIKPGITDYASIKFRNENEILENAENPEEFYINYLIPKKLELNLIYTNNPTVKNYFKIILLTLLNIIKEDNSKNKIIQSL